MMNNNNKCTPKHHMDSMVGLNGLSQTLIILALVIKILNNNNKKIGKTVLI